MTDFDDGLKVLKEAFSATTILDKEHRYALFYDIVSAFQADMVILFELTENGDYKIKGRKHENFCYPEYVYDEVFLLEGSLLLKEIKDKKIVVGNRSDAVKFVEFKNLEITDFILTSFGGDNGNENILL